MKEPIGFVISTLRAGGAQRVVANLSLELSSKYMVNIILLDGDAVGYPFEGRIVDLKTPPARTKVFKLLNAMRRICRLRKYKMKLRMKVIISFMENANFINLLSGRVGKRITSVRIYKKRQPKTLYGKVNRILMKLLYNKSDMIVAPSLGIKNDLINSFGLDEKKIIVIYNPCNINLIREKSDKANNNSRISFDNATVITMGRLTSQKGHWHLIRAFKRIIDCVPEMKLAILGKGPLEQYLRQLTNDLKLEGRIRFLGYQSNPFQYLANSAIFVLPSLYEGFPNVLIEAMGCEIPVIASDCLSGPREILAPGTNFMVQTNEVEFAEYGILTPVCDGKLYSGADELTIEEIKMAEAIMELYSNPERLKLYREKSLERTADFDPSIIGGYWIDLIEGKAHKNLQGIGD